MSDRPGRPFALDPAQERLVAFGLNEHYRQIFELTRLDEAIGIYDSEAEAFAEADAP